MTIRTLFATLPAMTKAAAEKNKIYSLTCFFSLLAGEDEAKKSTGDIEKWISEKEGSIIESAEIQRQALSYPIQKHREALSWTLRFTLPAPEVRKLNQQINSNKDIIRFLLTTAVRSSSKKARKVAPKTSLDSIKIIDKIEPLPVDLSARGSAAAEAPAKTDLSARASAKVEKDFVKESSKARIEDLDKKLEEILNQPIK